MTSTTETLGRVSTALLTAAASLHDQTRTIERDYPNADHATIKTALFMVNDIANDIGGAALELTGEIDILNNLKPVLKFKKGHYFKVDIHFLELVSNINTLLVNVIKGMDNTNEDAAYMQVFNQLAFQQKSLEVGLKCIFGFNGGENEK